MNKIPAAFSIALISASAAQAVTYTFSETTSGTTQWASGTGWDLTPVSAVDTVLDFSGDLTEGTNIVSNNDIAGNFLLNDINFNYAGTSTAPSPTVTLSGNPLEFSGAGARIFYDSLNHVGTTTTTRPQLIIDNNLVLSSDLTVYSNQSGPTPAVILNGAISGTGSLTFSSRAGSTTGWMINNPANSYAGDTRLTLSTTSGRTNILRLGASEVIPHGAGKGNLFFDASNEQGSLFLELNGFNETVNGLASGGLRDINTATNGAASVGAHRVRNTSATGATLTIGDNDASATFIGTLEDGVGGGAFGLTKIGTGEQVLSGVSTHTGTTAINGGSIKIDYSIYGTAETSDPTNYFSSQSAVTLGADTAFAIVGRGNGATTSTEGVAIANGDHQLTLPNEVADLLVVGQAMNFTKTGGTGTPATEVFIVAMDRGATTTVVSGNKRMSASGASTVTLDTTATIATTNQTLAGLTLTGAFASTATIDFGDTDNVILTISSAPSQLNNGSTITLANWNGSFSGGGGDQWLFVGDPTEFTSVLGQSEVIFDGYGAGYQVIDFGGSYEIVAVPEPTTYALVLALGALGVAIRRRQRG